MFERVIAPIRPLLAKSLLTRRDRKNKYNYSYFFGVVILTDIQICSFKFFYYF